MKSFLEICLDSVESCIAAERGGAQRVELCASLVEEGATPSAGMIAGARNSIGIALHVMIRPRGGDFCYTDAELEVMKRDVMVAKQLGADGVVFGILTRDGRVDADRTGELAALARPMSITFHRAFDMTDDPFLALEKLVELRIERVLTSGRAPSAVEGMELIHSLVKNGGGRIQVMAGGGITAENAREIRDKTGVREIHVGSGASRRVSASSRSGLFAAGSCRTVDSTRVTRIVEALRNH
ncbi:copper homeostasis protein CutC [bacterium]|nr:MAG: copper homeostasis protein CutC [bacterium]